MDPTAALTAIRALVTEAHKLTADDDPVVLAAVLNDLATTVEGLDQWLTSGGFAPQPWTPPAAATVAS